MTSQMKDQKEKTIFDVINDLTYNKVPWDKQEQKLVTPFMLNRWLSMNPDYIDTIAYCQPITDKLSPELYYKFYLDVLPKKKTFSKYVSGKKSDSVKDKLIDFIYKRLEISPKDAADLIENTDIADIKKYLYEHGYEEKRIKKEFGI